MRASEWFMIPGSSLIGINSPSPQISPVAAFAFPFPILNYHFPPRQHRLRHTFHLPSLIGAVIHAHVMRRGADSLLALRVENNEVRVRPDSDRSFFRKQPEDLRGCGRCQFDETIQADSSRSDSVVLDQTHPILHSRPAVGNLAEITQSQLFLLFETERAMIGRDDLQVVAAQTAP